MSNSIGRGAFVVLRDASVVNLGLVREMLTEFLVIPATDGRFATRSFYYSSRHRGEAAQALEEFGKRLDSEAAKDASDSLSANRLQAILDDVFATRHVNFKAPVDALTAWGDSGARRAFVMSGSTAKSKPLFVRFQDGTELSVAWLEAAVCLGFAIGLEQPKVTELRLREITQDWVDVFEGAARTRIRRLIAFGASNPAMTAKFEWARLPDDLKPSKLWPSMSGSRSANTPGTKNASGRPNERSGGGERATPYDDYKLPPGYDDNRCGNCGTKLRGSQCPEAFAGGCTPIYGK